MRPENEYHEHTVESTILAVAMAAGLLYSGLVMGWLIFLWVTR